MSSRTKTAALLLLIFSALTAARAQTAPSSKPADTGAAQQPAGPTVLHAGARLVVLDVTVRDAKGQAVRGLSPGDFRVAEDRRPQTVGSFEEHSSLTKEVLGPALPPLPPGTFTNYTPVVQNGPLNVLLLDSLNTPLKDQTYAQDQLRQFVDHAPEGERIAIFGLGQRLFLLQGFSADHLVLKKALDAVRSRSSPLLNDPGGNGSEPEKLSDQLEESVPPKELAALGDTVANLQQFEAEADSAQIQLRVRYTIGAFNALAHYLSAFRGRKNVIWFSGSFPINILPDASLNDPFAVMENNDAEFRETTGLLTAAQAAVYPVDARGLTTPPTYDAVNAGNRATGDPRRFTKDLNKYFDATAAEHQTMDAMAKDTGGQAFYNTNGLAAAVGQALDLGSNYYTLTYTPTQREAHGEYRSINLQLSGASAAKGYRLSYRRGYYADGAAGENKGEGNGGVPDAEGTAARRSEYARAAMSRGAPAPADILFKVAVQPTSAAEETELAPDNHTSPEARPKGPYRRYAIDYAVLARGLHLAEGADGRRTGAIEFLVYLFDGQGKLLISAGQALRLNLPPPLFSRIQGTGLGMRLEISAPVHGNTYMRIGVHDLTTDKFGVVEIPTSEVKALPPATKPAGPAATTPPVSTAPKSSGVPSPGAAHPQ